jgi:hypothetical protein
MLVKELSKNMISTFDLRVGNWVMASDVIHRITSVSETKVVFEGLKNSVKQEDLHAIALTKELLEKSDFRQLKETDLFEKIPLEGFTYKLHAQRILIFHPGDNTLCHWLNTRIVYVHQLQNLYYCLTGREIFFKF